MTQASLTSYAGAAWARASRRIAGSARLTQALREAAFSRARRRPPSDPAYPVTIVVVGRQKGVRHIQALARQFAPADLRVWALDGELPELAEHVVGRGPGAKFELLNRMVQARPIPADHWVVVADDDVVLSHGSANTLLAIGDRAGFDLFQPAHSVASFHSHDFVVGRPLVKADLVSFVEIGPLFVISPAARAQFLPFPEGIGMGYGLELTWWRQQQDGARLGLVSQTRLVHCSPVGKMYPSEEEEARLSLALTEYGFHGLWELPVTLSTWWRWAAQPPWSAPSSAGDIPAPPEPG